jgi:hypothetical protein
MGKGMAKYSNDIDPITIMAARDFIHVFFSLQKTNLSEKANRTAQLNITKMLKRLGTLRLFKTGM